MPDIDCQCGKRLNIPESRVGKSGKCPYCKRHIHLVSPDPGVSDKEFSACLLGISGPAHNGDQFFLAGSAPIQVGKISEAHIKLTDVKISRSHCQLVRTGQHWRIEDQKSTNGVFVNGKRVEACDLNDSDRIRLGSHEFKFLTTFTKPQAKAAQSAQSKRPPVVAVSAKPVQASPPEDDMDLMDDNHYGLVDGEDAELPAATAPPSQEAASVTAVATGGPICPSCKKALPPGAKICVECGINVQTGRAILTAYDGDLDSIYSTAENVVQWISWIIPFGIYPIASEAFGTKKPYVIRGIAILTTLTSLLFLALIYSDSPKAESWINLMLWAGTTNTTKLQQASMVETEPDSNSLDMESHGTGDVDETKNDEAFEESDVDLADVEDFVIPEYRPSQLLTHTLLHAGFMHLAGNLLFMLVFGSRVNALIGNITSAVIYPMLAIMAALFHMAAYENEPLHPVLGASGAIMGLAGLYLVLFPLHKVHTVLWYRLGLFFGFRLSFKVYAIRGFCVVLFYIAFDVLYTALGIEDDVARWAHLGGFIAGIVLGLAMLMTRLVNGRGGDLISVVLGKYAWNLIGPPNRDRTA